MQFVIVRFIDRFTRAGTSAYEQLKQQLHSHGVELIDTMGVIQPSRNMLEHLGVEYDWSRYSPSEISELMAATHGKIEVTNILTRLIGREIELVREGYQIGPANDGYVNKRVYVGGKKKVVQVADPDRSMFYSAMFKLRAQGIYTDQEIVEQVNALGFLTKERRRWDHSQTMVIGSVGRQPLTVKKLQAVVCQPIYAGIICEKWTNYQPIRAKYAGLVDVETFNQANRGKVFIQETSNDKVQILYDHYPVKRVQKRQRFNPLFTYKRVVRCSWCRHPLLGSSPTGKSGQRFPIYHCARGGHQYFGVKKKILDELVIDFVSKLQFSKSTIGALEKKVIDAYQRRESEHRENSTAVRVNIVEIKAEQAAVLKALIGTTSAVARQKLEEEIEALEQRLVTAEQQPTEAELTRQNLAEFTEYLHELMEHPGKWLITAKNPYAQQTLFGLVFDEYPTYSDLSSGTPKLSLMFESAMNLENSKSVVVDSAGFEWNSLRVTVARWMHTFRSIGS